MIGGEVRFLEIFPDFTPKSKTTFPSASLFSTRNTTYTIGQPSEVLHGQTARQAPLNRRQQHRRRRDHPRHPRRRARSPDGAGGGLPYGIEIGPGATSLFARESPGLLRVSTHLFASFSLYLSSHHIWAVTDRRT